MQGRWRWGKLETAKTLFSKPAAVLEARHDTAKVFCFCFSKKKCLLLELSKANFYPALTGKGRQNSGRQASYSNV
jgi:hypothetical protein